MALTDGAKYYDANNTPAIWSEGLETFVTFDGERAPNFIIHTQDQGGPMRFNYTLTGAIEVPEGSMLTESGSGIVLPNGKALKVWESWELHTPGEDDHEDLTFDQVLALGCFYDGDSSRFEEVESTDQLWPPA